MVSNSDFLNAIFAEDAPFAHVTGFAHDPGAIPEDQTLRAWAGSWFSRYPLRDETNQYFCISIFNPDQNGTPRRRKALFLRTRVIVLDDVREKLSVEAAQRLPPPAWVLETSPGSEQWGYILTEPCHVRHRVENLLDGLVANGLAPDGKDPGMKGVTRYVRLPGGVNNKASKLVDGAPWRCRLLTWEPARRASLEDLAAPFLVDLDVIRREARLDGAADVPDHPILQIPDIIHIKEVRSDGRFDITCPWVGEHTGAIDNGTAVFTNEDGSIGFKCHHGTCEARTARDLVRWVEQEVPGWGQGFASWRAFRAFQVPEQPEAPPPPPPGEEPPPAATGDPLADSIQDIGRMEPGSLAQRRAAERCIEILEGLPSEADRIHYHKQLCDVMHWSKGEFKGLLRSLRDQWAEEKKGAGAFFDDHIYVKNLDRIYEVRTGDFHTVTAFQNAHCHQDNEAAKTALMGRAQKVDRVDFAPGRPHIFEEEGVTYANLWTVKKVRPGRPGDATPWLRHFEAMGWEGHRERILQYMAFTLLHPEKKINHMLILGGYEGSGKDFLLHPLVKAMEGAYGRVIHGDQLLSDFNEYLFATKLLVVNESDLADQDRGDTVANRIKPLAAAPPEMIDINKKNVSLISVRNLVNLILTTNSLLPIKLKGTSRRMYCCWSDLKVRGDDDNVTPEWQAYWDGMWAWMLGGGWEHCLWYLRNCVDLTGFNPGAAPPVTDFQRDMQEASKSAGVLTVEAFIRQKVGLFGADLITAVDAASTIRAANLTGHESLLYTDAGTMTPPRVMRLLKDAGCHQVSAIVGDVETKLWTLRNHQAYRGMSSEQIQAQYLSQKEFATTGKPMLHCV